MAPNIIKRFGFIRVFKPESEILTRTGHNDLSIEDESVDRLENRTGGARVLIRLLLSEFVLREYSEKIQQKDYRWK